MLMPIVNCFLQHLPEEFSNSPLLGFHFKQDFNAAFVAADQPASGDTIIKVIFNITTIVNFTSNEI